MLKQIPNTHPKPPKTRKKPAKPRYNIQNLTFTQFLTQKKKEYIENNNIITLSLILRHMYVRNFFDDKKKRSYDQYLKLLAKAEKTQFYPEKVMCEKIARKKGETLANFKKSI